MPAPHKEESYQWKTGSLFRTTTVTITTQKSETPSGYLLGDADGDGEVTILDATWIQRVLVGIDAPADFNEAAADVDGDGEMTILDVTYIQRYLVGVAVPYAIEEIVYNE